MILNAEPNRIKLQLSFVSNSYSNDNKEVLVLRHFYGNVQLFSPTCNVCIHQLMLYYLLYIFFVNILLYSGKPYIDGRPTRVLCTTNSLPKHYNHCYFYYYYTIQHIYSAKKIQVANIKLTVHTKSYRMPYVISYEFNICF